MPTEFENKVYEATKKIPSGKISTYKNIAIAIGNPRAVQAVGNALRKNPFAPIVPCHRVLPSTYMIGGFFGETNKSSDLVKKKIKLLESEGIKFEGSQIAHDEGYRQKITHQF
jgi:methylated-DNA-[protein]-cysteine S-methyltransferase